MFVCISPWNTAPGPNTHTHYDDVPSLHMSMCSDCHTNALTSHTHTHTDNYTHTPTTTTPHTHTNTHTHTHTNLRRLQSCLYTHHLKSWKHAQTRMCTHTHARTHARTHAITHARTHTLLTHTLPKTSLSPELRVII